MRYFRVGDNVYIKGRWHLSMILDGNNEPDFFSGVRLTPKSPLTTTISHPGKPLEFFITSFSVPVVVHRLARAMEPIAPNSIQLLPLLIPAYSGFDAINLLQVVDCFDERRSKFDLYPPGYHRPHLVGNYTLIEEAHVDPARIPADAHAFRVARWRSAFIVSENMKEVMERVGCKGATFTDVT